MTIRPFRPRAAGLLGLAAVLMTAACAAGGDDASCPPTEARYQRLGPLEGKVLYLDDVAALECVARRRNAHAAFILARAYDTGAGVDEDPARAYDWYVKAHGWGHLEAGLFVANALYLGRGHRRNLTAATRWATAALDAGLPGAAELLGEILAESRR